MIVKKERAAAMPHLEQPNTWRNQLAAATFFSYLEGQVVGSSLSARVRRFVGDRGMRVEYADER